MERRREVDPTVAAGHRLIQAVLTDTELVAHIAEQEIDRRIQSGELIRAEALQLGGGLELTPVGRLRQLETFVASLTNPDASTAGVAEAAAAALAGPAVPDEAEDDEAAPEDELERRRRPKGFPVEGDELVCAECGEELVPVKKQTGVHGTFTTSKSVPDALTWAQLVFTRGRKVHCEPCLDVLYATPQEAAQ